jgi:HD-like signal output (HDOD) protein
MITAPPASLEEWVTHLAQFDVPVLRKSVRELARLRGEEDSVGGRNLAAAVLQDPLFTAKVLGYMQSHRRGSQTTDITTIDRAVMMLGISPFFRAFEGITAVEDALGQTPEALLGLLKVIGRARRAAHYARDWALLRHDLDVEEITVAAMLHDVAELLLWCFAPKLALQVQALQKANPTMRSADAQQQILGIRVLDLQLALADSWHLPQLLRMLMDDLHATNQRVKNVVYAVRLARHSANGWVDPALPDDFNDIAELLHLTPEQVMMRLGVDPYLVAELPASVSRSSEGS